MRAYLFIIGASLAGLAVAPGAENPDGGIKLWIESEDYAAQQGSTAPNYAMPGASANLIVDNDWGGRATDFLRYEVELPADMPKVYVAIRYARAMPGDSVVILRMDNKDDLSRRLHLPSTGGWGFRDNEWKFAQAELSRAGAGHHILEILSTQARNNVNTDGFFLSDRPIDLSRAASPVFPEKTALKRVEKIDFHALRAAMRRLASEYGSRYQKEREFLLRLEAIERERDKVLMKAKKNAAAALVELEKVADEFDALQHEALVEANPLLDFPALLFTRRHPLGGQHYAYTEALSWNHDRQRTWRPDSALCKLSPVRRGGEATALLDSPHGVIRDPDVYWDGAKVLFSHKKDLNKDDYHLYELDVKTGRVTQLTKDAGFADYEGCYLPNGQIMFNSTRCVQTVDCFPTPASNLYLMDADGRNIRRVTVNPVHDNFPSVLNDGRVIFTRWEYNDRWVLYVQGLAVMNPDGTGCMAFYGNNSFWPISMLHARAIPGTTKIVCTLSGHHDVDQCGEIGVFDSARGAEEASGCVQLWPRREIKSIRDEFYWSRLSEQYQYPWPLSEHFFLVSCRPRGQNHFGIYLIDSFGDRCLIHEEPNVSCNSPMPLTRRRRPPIIAPQVDCRQKEATVFMADIYGGRGLEGVKRGEVKSLRIIEILCRPTGTQHWAGMDGTPPMGLCSSWDAKRVLGAVPVSEDGSALFEIPANTAVYFQPLDEKGRALQWMRSWVTAQPGETIACVGCHESKHKTPPATYTPAMSRKPDHIKQWYTGDRPFSFYEDVQCVLDCSCTRCHDQNDKKGLDLRGDKTDAFSLAYEHLRRYVKVPGTRQDPPMNAPKSYGAIASPLIQMLEKGHYGVKLSREETDRLITWIDLNGPYYGTYAITRYTANFGRCVVEDARPLWGALGDRCFQCHSRPSQVPSVPEGGFARFGDHKGRDFRWSTKGGYDTSNAVLINLTHPEQSRLLRAPLSKESGGLGLCQPTPLASTDDPVYQAALKVIRSWAEELKQRPREDMPGAVPCKEYQLWSRMRERSLAIEKASRRNLAQR